jgi:hypothetical protein
MSERQPAEATIPVMADSTTALGPRHFGVGGKMSERQPAEATIPVMADSTTALGPRHFGSRIRNAAFLLRYRPPMNILRYAGEMNPSLWLEDY